MSRPRSSLTLMLSWIGLMVGYMLGRSGPTVPEPLPTAIPRQPKTRQAALRNLEGGSAGAGGYYAAWPKDSGDAAVAEHIEFQFANMAHQTDTAMSGMWLFLATELLFFGGLFFLYLVYRMVSPDAIAEASRHAEVGIGTINTALLLTSSAVYVYGLGCAQEGRNRCLFWACVITAALGVCFLGLKAYEWMDDFNNHLFPGADFAIKGANAGPAKLFWCFYFIGTGLHGIHMIFGIGLVAWIARNARAGIYSRGYHTPVEAVGLYWSFVDMVWLMLYPTIYLAGLRS